MLSDALSKNNNKLSISSDCGVFFYVQDYVTLRGEVFFPNLLFEKTAMDFGCILNDTEVTRYINIVNNSPLQVSLYFYYMAILINVK